MPASDLGPSELQDEGLGGWEPVKLTYEAFTWESGPLGPDPAGRKSWILVSPFPLLCISSTHLYQPLRIMATNRFRAAHAGSPS